MNKTKRPKGEIKMNPKGVNDSGIHESWGDDEGEE
jgi:hypothetical protein